MPTKSRVKEQLEKGWNNDLKVRQTVGLVGNKHIFSPDDNVKPFVESKSEVELFDPTVSSIARGRLELSSRPKPLTAYASISTTLGFVHHDGTDEAKELDVIRYIMARESIILKLQNLCHKIGQCDKLVQSSMLLESELLDTLALMRATTVNFVEVLCSWRESSENHDSQNPRTFFWENQNYTTKVIHDLDFLADQPMLVESLQLTADKMRANPLMLPNTLEEGDTWINSIERAISDSGGHTEGEFYEERLRVRKAERVLLIELELKETQDKSFFDNDDKNNSSDNNGLTTNNNSSSSNNNSQSFLDLSGMTQKDNIEVARLTSKLNDIIKIKKTERTDNVDDIIDSLNMINSTNASAKTNVRSTPSSPKHRLSPRGADRNPRPETSDGSHKRSPVGNKSYNDRQIISKKRPSTGPGSGPGSGTGSGSVTRTGTSPLWETTGLLACQNLRTELFEQITSMTEIRSATDLRPDVPAQVAVACRRCLRKSPRERFQNVDELLDALKSSRLLFLPNRAAMESNRS